ncbi:MAG: hemolysin family protein [Actinomycetota bacterium]
MLILVHAFFVAGEFAMLAVDRSTIQRMADEGHRGAVNTLKALKRLSFQLSGAQLGITVTSLIVGFIIEPTVGDALEPLISRVDLIPEDSTFAVSVAVALALATATEMVVAELIPKNLAIAKPLSVAVAVVTPLRLINGLFRPLIVWLNSAANGTVRLLRIEPREELIPVRSLEELDLLIRSSRQTGALGEAEFSLLARSISFGGKTVADALVPRVAVVALSREQTIADMAAAAVETGHSRFPVYGRDLDDISGIAHFKDGFTVQLEMRPSTSVAQIMQAAPVVPESRDLGSLLLEMRREQKQMAIVVDEYGGTAGIITLEDLLEEIVGEIEDEHDPRSRSLELTTPMSGTHLVSGLLHFDEMKEATGFEIPEGDYDTLAGFLLSLVDRIPQAGDHASYKGWEFKVVSMDKKRIDKVLVVAPPREGENDEEGS